MAPKRKSPAAPVMSPRKTRSMAAGKRGAVAPAKEEEEAEAVPVRAAAGPKGRKKGKKEDADAVVEKEEDADAVPEPKQKQKGRKKAKKEVAAAVAEEDDGAAVEDGKRLVVVEACTQCQHFKKRALKVKEDLESAVPGVSVIINPEKPRRGCLEIREEAGEVFISLLNMPRPFTAMKKLDMDEVIQDIVKKIS